MGQRKTLGGDRLGSGRKQKVDTATFNRSTHDLGYIWRSTMSAGTLVPFMVEVALPGDSFDINLGCEVLTLPTLGPLFGSMKVQLDVFTAPVRLYNAMLHNNRLGIGLNMAQVKLPVMTWEVPYRSAAELAEIQDIDNWQVNPSSILSYLGVRGFGIKTGEIGPSQRNINAIPLLAYWDIFKQYYANKQEQLAWMIHTAPTIPDTNVTSITIGASVLGVYPATNDITLYDLEVITVVTTALQDASTIMIGHPIGTGIWQWIPLSELGIITNQTATIIEVAYNASIWGDAFLVNTWRYKDGTDLNEEIDLVSFPLENIDTMREAILGYANPAAPLNIFDTGLEPYQLIGMADGEFRSITSSQEGLAVKTYQSDLFNNWLNTEYIDGVNGIAAVTAVSTAGDEFTIDSLILHKKVYDMLNDVLVSGGTYDDWQEVVYDHEGIRRAETPIYYGSLIKELQFQEVVSNSASSAGGAVQPLGELAGRGRLGNKHKGGTINIKVDEISYVMGIISITPRLDYSQGNDWHTSLETMDDFHKPHLDEIGFQELITEQMAWWDTRIDATGAVVTKSAGKQPAWLNYMTNVNKVKGNFAIRDNSMFMVLTRRYNAVPNVGENYLNIEDLTTYIDPRHFNHIFAQTSLDSQNYWVQIGVDMTVRRKMSARVMPNL